MGGARVRLRLKESDRIVFRICDAAIALPQFDQVHHDRNQGSVGVACKT
jgi:hypothetical protein